MNYDPEHIVSFWPDFLITYAQLVVCVCVVWLAKEAVVWIVAEFKVSRWGKRWAWK